LEELALAGPHCRLWAVIPASVSTVVPKVTERREERTRMKNKGV